MTIEPGTVLARRYRADKLLGRGGMGEVWRCHDVEQRADVAVKAVRPELLRDTWAARLFHGEVAAVARLAHPSIVPVYDLVTEADGTAYLVMAARDGRLLSALVAEQPSWPATRALLEQLLSALAYAHARGVLHLDIKPDNVLVDGEGDELRITIVDFGISRIRRPGQGVDQWVSRAAVVGTVGYLAPERCAGVLERFGPWTDLYSVGVLAYELCAGARPFPDGAALPSLLRRMSEPAPPLVPRRPDVPRGFVDLCARLLAIEPRERPLRAADVLHELRELDEGTPATQDGVSARAASVSPAASGPAAPSLLPLHMLRAASLVPLLGDTFDTSTNSSVLVPASQRPSVDAATLSAMTVTAAEAFRAEPAAPHAGAYGLFGLRDLPVLGRLDERGRLWSAVAAAVSQRTPRVVLLEGPAGVGKSRLARDALERAEELGLCVAMQTAWSADASGDEGLRALVENVLDCRGATLEGVRARLAVWLERIPGDHRAFAREVELLLRPPPDASPDAGLPLRVAVDMVARTSALRPVLVWLDDVHHSRGQAEALLHALAAWPEPIGVCLVATARDEDGDRAAARALLAFPGAELVPMGRMDPHATRQLVRGLLDVDDDLCEVLASRAEGNPLFASELLRQLVANGALERRDGRYRLVPGETASEIPDDIGALWDRRIAHSGADRRDLAGLAVVRERVSLEVAAHLSSLLPSLELSLSRALWAGLCSVRGGAYVWAHGLLRAHLVAGLDRVSGASLHGHAAVALAPLVGREDVQEERARHLSRASGRAREACEAMLDAGLWSWRHAENDARRSRFETLVDWSQAVGFPDLDARGSAELAYLAAETGEEARADELLASARDALEVGDFPEAAAWVAVRHSQSVRLFGRVDEGTMATAEALRLARAAGAEEVESLALMQQGLDKYRRHDFEGARELLDRAAASCRARGDRLGEAHALRTLVGVADGASTLDLAERALGLAHDAGAPRVEMICRQVWIGALWHCGRHERARAEARALAQEAARCALRQTVSVLELQGAVWAVSSEDWTTAREHRERAERWGASAGGQVERVLFHAIGLVLALVGGDVEAADQATTALEAARQDYDDEDLRELLERAVGMAPEPLRGRLTALWS